MKFCVITLYFIFSKLIIFLKFAFDVHFVESRTLIYFNVITLL